MLFGALVLLCCAASSWAADVCCPDIGCFTDDRPFNLLPLPSCINDIDPTYTMYTQDDRVIGEEFDHESVPNNFVASRRTVVVIHGYQGDDGNNWMDEMKDAFLVREDINVIVLGWEGGADILNYLQAASNTRTTGAYTGLVLQNLADSPGGDITQMWCVGHSLGSHVCGHTHVTTTIGRITGMDPAGPSFESSDDLTIGLNPDSADFVDIIHTDYEVYGTLRPLGDIDFYPSGGHEQPGCGADALPCNHFRAVFFMEESVYEECFTSNQQCSNHENIPLSCDLCTCAGECAIMGYGVPFGCEQSGIYYLEVDNNEPYCQG